MLFNGIQATRSTEDVWTCAIPGDAGPQRSELVVSGSDGKVLTTHPVEFGDGAKPRWYHWRFMVPSGQDLSKTANVSRETDNILVVGQLWQIPDTADTWHPPAFGIDIRNGSFRFRRCADPNPASINDASKLLPWTLAEWPLVFDVWQDVYVGALFSYTGQGWMVGIANGRVLFNDTAPNCHNDSPLRNAYGADYQGIVMKGGIYCYGPTPPLRILHRAPEILGA